MEWNTAAIRELLSAAFDDQELTTLCFDHFRPVYQALGSGMSNPDKIQRLLDYCDRHEELAKLVQLVQELNPAQYRRYASQLKQAPRSAEPATRDESLSDMALADYGHRLDPKEGQRAAVAPRFIGPNPFGDRGRINDSARFFNRQQLVREMQQLLINRSSISVVGPSEVGKSSLLYYLCLTRNDWIPDVPVEYFDLQRIFDEQDFCRTILTRLGRSGDTLYDLKCTLEGQCAILLFDEVERLAEPEFHPRLHDLLRSLAQEPALAMVVTTQQPLDQLFPARGKTSPFHNVFTVKRVEPFTPAQVRAFLVHRLAGTGVAFTHEEIDDLIARTGGHPAQLQEAAYHLYAERR